LHRFVFLFFRSLRRVANRLSSCFIKRKPCFCLELDSKVQVWEIIVIDKKKVFEYIIDETIIKVGSNYIWIWVAIESENKEILGMSISKERNTFVRVFSVRCCRGIWRTYCFNIRRWYMVSSSIKVLEFKPSSSCSSYEKSIIERTI
jgi:putative transposase